MLPSYWASILCRHSLHFSSLYTGCGRASGRKLLAEDPSSSLRPPATCVNAYLVLCPPCGDLLAYDHTSSFFFKETKTTTTTTKEKSCIEWKISEGSLVKFAVRSPGVASFYSFIYIPFLPGLLLFSNSITLFHLTLPLRKGMQMQIGPIVFNCMH